MARRITRITDWKNVNWDEVDFDNFERASLNEAGLDEVAQFSQRHKAYLAQHQDSERRAYAEAHFKRALVEGRDPRSDRLFGEYQEIYQELIDKHIPRSQPWDLRGIEKWSKKDWASFDWKRARYLNIDPFQRNYKLLTGKEMDKDSHRYHHLPPRHRHIRRIVDWDDVDWDEVDFDNYDEASLLEEPYEFEHYREFQKQHSYYNSLWKALEDSKRKWDDFDFSTVDWGATSVLDLDPHMDPGNHKRAHAAYDAWYEAKQKQPPAQGETGPAADPVPARKAKQRGITLPDAS